MMRCMGTAVCPGIVLERCHKLVALPKFDTERKTDAPVDESLMTLTRAVESLQAEYAAFVTGAQVGASADVIAVQLAMLGDEYFLEGINECIREGYAPEAAVLRMAGEQEEALRALDDDYISARAEDVHDLGVRLACLIAQVPYPSLANLEEDCIVVAHDMLPSMLMKAQVCHIRGIVIETGTKTSHVSILASGLEIPMVVSCAGAMGAGENEWVYMDGDQGYFGHSLSEAEVCQYAACEKAYRQQKKELQKFIAREARTADGKRIEVCTNIVDSITLDKALAYGADGVGLFRTEFLYMNRPSLPTEDEQYHILRQAATRLGGLPLVVRTLDIGGDKGVEYLHLPQEENPFLGYRAVRICMERPDILIPQLRAILRASAAGNVQVMFPMIAIRRELLAMKKAVEEAKMQLRGEGIPFAEDIRIGIMVEIPSAVVMLDQLVPMVDFVSIGSNDLIQYTYAADRMNDKVSYLHDFMDPAVLRLIRRTIAVSDEHGIACSLCGEMAGDEIGLAVLVALGITKVSVSSSKVLKTKQLISRLNASSLENIGKDLIKATDATEAIRCLRAGLPADYPGGVREGKL